MHEVLVSQPTRSILKGAIFNPKLNVFEVYFNISVLQLHTLLPRSASSV